jgi:hypothetical protein
MAADWPVPEGYLPTITVGSMSDLRVPLPPLANRNGGYPRLDQLLRGLLSLRVGLPSPAHQRASRLSVAMHKFKRLKNRPSRAWAWLNAVIRREPRLFVH